MVSFIEDDDALNVGVRDLEPGATKEFTINILKVGSKYPDMASRCRQVGDYTRGEWKLAFCSLWESHFHHVGTELPNITIRYE